MTLSAPTYTKTGAAAEIFQVPGVAIELGAIVAPLNPIYTEHELEGPIREHGVETLVNERVVWEKPFCNLVHFERERPAGAPRQPSLLIVNGVHIWTQEHLGFGARSIALVDEAAQSPLAMLADVPLLKFQGNTVFGVQDGYESWFTMLNATHNSRTVIEDFKVSYTTNNAIGSQRDSTRADIGGQVITGLQGCEKGAVDAPWN
mgnify:CR=1 FL=1